MQDRRVDRADLQLDRAGIAKFLRQRNVLPAELWRAHVDGVEPGRGAAPAVQEAGPGLEGEGGLVAVLESFALEDLLRHAAHAVAAGAGFRAVIVEDRN